MSTLHVCALIRQNNCKVLYCGNVWNRFCVETSFSFFLCVEIKNWCDLHKDWNVDNESMFSFPVLGSSINDITQFWTIFDPPLPIITRFITKALELLSQNFWPLPPPKTVISFIDDPQNIKTFEFETHLVKKSFQPFFSFLGLF